MLDNLTRGVRLANRSGLTATWPPLRSPYLTLNELDAGATVKVVLRFKNPKSVAVRFQARVLAGLGTL